MQGALVLAGTVRMYMLADGMIALPLSKQAVIQSGEAIEIPANIACIASALLPSQSSSSSVSLNHPPKCG